MTANIFANIIVKIVQYIYQVEHYLKYINLIAQLDTLKQSHNNNNMYSIILSSAWIHINIQVNTFVSL